MPFLFKKMLFTIPAAAVMLLASTAAAQNISTFVPAPDGIQLATDVYLPAVGDSWPVVLIRTPYGKDQHVLECTGFALSGFACVAQDTRGRFASGGIDTVFRDDGPDGRATLEWIVDQPWCNGSIGTYGGSAVGMTQYALAPDAHPALKCQLPAFATPSLRDHAFLQGGAMRTALVETWLEDQGSFYFLDELKEHRLDGPWWDDLRFLDEAESVHTSGLHVGGWYDVFQQGAIDAFRTYQHNGGDGARGNQFLVMGPWTHGGGAGELGYSIDPEAMLISLVLPWFEHCLKGIENEVERWPPVSIFLMGAVGEQGAPGNEWVTMADWPPPSRALMWYLNAEGGLAGTPPASSDSVLMIDPLNPVPTLGGANLHPWLEVDGRQMGDGSYDQRSIEDRADVYTYTSAPLERPLSVMGRVSAHLWIRADTRDLDLAVRLTDVYPDGRSMLVLDGIQRARMRCGGNQECFLTPGKPTEISVDLWSTAIVFNTGHRIRIDISGTNSPRFEPNPNDGTDLDHPVAHIVARPALLFGPDTPSRLELPVVVEPRQASGRGSG